ncbi:HD domain-containing protein [Alkalibacillus haloalkaliphilus]|uniref:HD domain-containing protein n=1 Tax=Alkalibacillus haloalkaliphilus TaxID=94136 RepID=UPI0002D4138C|nr:HD domain-containing protein [Alkalibacillus haloalkaliphilus]
MKRVQLVDIFDHPITQKYLIRSGIHHAVSTTEQAVKLAKARGVDVELSAKSALLHDIGHYEWYNDGEWDYQEYRKHDIHAIKGAERAHKLLIRLGEDRKTAKAISVTILLHTDSYLPFSVDGMRTPLHEVVYEADEMEELPGGKHHYKTMTIEEALKRLKHLDQEISQKESPHQSIS